MTLKYSSIWPLVDSEPLDFVLSELPFVARAISEIKDPLAFLLALPVLAFITSIIRPSLDSQTMLFVIHPLLKSNSQRIYSYIPGILSSVYMNIGSLAICFILFPFSFVNVAIGMNQFAVATTSILYPLSLVDRTVRPDLLACTITVSHEPLSVINCPFVQGHWWEFCPLVANLVTLLLKLLVLNRFLVEFQRFF